MENDKTIQTMDNDKTVQTMDNDKTVQTMDNDKSHKEPHKTVIENHMNNCNVFQGDIYGATFPLPGAQVTNHYNYYGTGQPQQQQQHSPQPQQDAQRQQQPRQDAQRQQQSQQSSEPQQSSESQQERRKQVTAAIASRLDFGDGQLGCDPKGKRMSNDRLRGLLHSCLGMTVVRPSAENRQAQEILWTLLTDKRERCFKEAGEDFFRQTVLNVIGHFKHQGLLRGGDLELARCMFKNINESQAKNVSRGIPESFPESVSRMLDHYIGSL